MLRSVGGVSVALLMAFCAACGSTGVTVTEGWEDLEMCRVDAPVGVEDLASDPRLRDCNVEGVVVLFPDGQELTASPVAVASGYEEVDNEYYSLTNWGIEGLSAAFVSEDSLKVWGSEEAVELHVEAIYRGGDLTS